MQLQTSVQSESKIQVSAPPTRSDVLHPCDVAEVSGYMWQDFLISL